MEPYSLAYESDRLFVCVGDSRGFLTELPDDTVDAVITDPPYALAFMSKDWDTMHPDPGIWKHCMRVLKPGGHLLSFGGTRTYHRLACDIEDGGFEIRDSIAWLYGSGFPKSMDVHKQLAAQKWSGRTCIMCGGSGKDEIPERACRCCNGHGREAYTDEWQGWGTALKPAFEPIVVARKPFKGTVAANVLAHGTGALNIDASRVGMSDADREAARVPMPVQHNDSHGTYHAGHGVGRNGERFEPAAAGRWPPNVLMDESQAEALDEQSGMHTSGKAKEGGHKRNQPPGEGIYGGGRGLWTEEGDAGTLYGDTGASRFFPTFKYQAKAPKKERPSVDGVSHPTVKPLELMRWLVRLVTPAGGVVLDPFAGTGTTGQAALMEGHVAVLCERELSYIPLIMERLKEWVVEPSQLAQSH